MNSFSLGITQISLQGDRSRWVLNLFFVRMYNLIFECVPSHQLKIALESEKQPRTIPTPSTSLELGNIDAFAFHLKNVIFPPSSFQLWIDSGSIRQQIVQDSSKPSLVWFVGLIMNHPLGVQDVTRASPLSCALNLTLKIESWVKLYLMVPSMILVVISHSMKGIKESVLSGRKKVGDHRQLHPCSTQFIFFILIFVKCRCQMHYGFFGLDCAYFPDFL